jgi:hypothetical protein
MAGRYDKAARRAASLPSPFELCRREAEAVNVIAGAALEAFKPVDLEARAAAAHAADLCTRAERAGRRAAAWRAEVGRRGRAFKAAGHLLACCRYRESMDRAEAARTFHIDAEARAGAALDVSMDKAAWRAVFRRQAVAACHVAADWASRTADLYETDGRPGTAAAWWTCAAAWYRAARGED